MGKLRIGNLLRAIALVPIYLCGYGADFRFQSASLSQTEWNAHHKLRKADRVPKTEPSFAWIAATTPRLVATSSLLLWFTQAQLRREFGPGYEVEFARPVGEYQAWGWSFPTDTENKDGQLIDHNVVRLERLPTEDTLSGL